MHSTENLKRLAKVYTKILKGNENEQDILSLNFTSAQVPDHDCEGQILVEARRCNVQNDNKDECLQPESEEGPPKFCLLPPMRGNCGNEVDVRYFFNSATEDCGQFVYTGCDGSQNSFETYAECRKICIGILISNHF